jgi:cysteine desulfurase/selenocysteine lyase
MKNSIGWFIVDNAFTKIRAEFPALTQRVNGKPLIYLDSAASALKPWSVIERLGHYYTYETSNVHRGAHYLSDRATQYFEESRIKVKQFLNADSEREIIFTKGTTESINLVAQSLGEFWFQSGDEILLTEMEHHSNIVPWQILADKKGLKVKFASVSESGELDLKDFESKISDKTKLIAVVHCSNTLGTINPIIKISNLAKQKGIPVLVDGAQSVTFMKIDVRELGIDFFCFSGHKIYGPNGVGVLWGKTDWLNKMPPYQGGGSMIKEVTLEKTTFNDIPYKFEAGTPAVGEVIAMGAAIDAINKWGHQNIQEHEQHILKTATSKISGLKNVKFFGQATAKGPILSFYFTDCHSADVGSILDQQGIAVRVGHLCTLPILQKFKVKSLIRASFAVFSNEKDVDSLMTGLEKARGMLL